MIDFKEVRGKLKKKTFSKRPNLINTSTFSTSRNGWKQVGAELGQAQFLLCFDETDVKVIVGVSYLLRVIQCV